MLQAIRSQMIFKLLFRKNIPIRIKIGQQNILCPGNFPEFLRAGFFILFRTSIRMITSAEIPVGPLYLIPGRHLRQVQYIARFLKYLKTIHKIVDSHARRPVRHSLGEVGSLGEGWLTALPAIALAEAG